MDARDTHRHSAQSKLYTSIHRGATRCPPRGRRTLEQCGRRAGLRECGPSRMVSVSSACLLWLVRLSQRRPCQQPNRIRCGFPQLNLPGGAGRTRARSAAPTACRVSIRAQILRPDWQRLQHLCSQPVAGYVAATKRAAAFHCTNAVAEKRRAPRAGAGDESRRSGTRPAH